MTDLFAPGLVDQLQAQWPDVDVHAMAALVRDWCERRGRRHARGVRNPSGLLVSWTRDAAAKIAERRRVTTAVSAAEQERYAALHAELYRALALQELSPAELADLLDGAAARGFGKLNPRTSARLRAMGDSWSRDR
jgi:hypothetical protein